VRVIEVGWWAGSAIAAYRRTSRALQDDRRPPATRRTNGLAACSTLPLGSWSAKLSWTRLIDRRMTAAPS